MKIWRDRIKYGAGMTRKKEEKKGRRMPDRSRKRMIKFPERAVSGAQSETWISRSGI